MESQQQGRWIGRRYVRGWTAGLVLLLVLLCGCRGSSYLAEAGVTNDRPPALDPAKATAEISTENVATQHAATEIRQASYSSAEVPRSDSVEISETAVRAGEPPLQDTVEEGATATAAAQLTVLELSAEQANPELRRLKYETTAAWGKVRYADKLPDPTLGANFFGHPIETAAGSQRANFSAMQMIPWLERLDAQTQVSCYEAMAMQQMYLAERLKVIGDLRTGWIRLYVLKRQRGTLEANQQLLSSVGDLVTARLSQNRGSVGDVTLLTVELGRLEEQIITTEQQIRSTQAELNRLAGRPPEVPIGLPDSLSVKWPDWSMEMLRQVAREKQPAIAAAQLRTSASSWGIKVAELKRRPDVSVNASWFAIDDNRPPSGMVDVGQDAWALGAQVSIPLWESKYDAMRDEARARHFAAHASVDELHQRFDALLRDLWEQGQAAQEITELYTSTIIPQAQQTLESDQQALANGTVDLDRVIQDIRAVLTLELAHDRAVGQLATAIARIRQAVGVDLSGDREQLSTDAATR